MFWDDDDWDDDDWDDDDWNDDDWDDDDWDDDDDFEERVKKKAFAIFHNRVDDDDVEDREDYEDIIEDLKELKEDMDDDWDDSWENDWEDIFDLSWNDAFWKSKGRNLPLKVSCFSEIKGAVGELVVASKLAELEKEYFHVFNDVLLEIGNTSCQIDHIVVSIFGIFVIETKNYSGIIYGKEKDNKWTQYLGDRKYRFYNPIKQNERHIEVLKQCLGCPKEYFIPVVVFSRNSDLRISTESPVLYADTMLRYIDSFYYPSIKKNDMGAIDNKIINSCNPSYEARERHKRRYRFHKK